MLRIAGAKAGKAAAGAAVLVASSAAGGDAAECRNAETALMPTNMDDALAMSAELVKQELKEQGMLSSVHSADGTEWLDVSMLIDLATSVAADPSVQKVMVEKEREQLAFHSSVRAVLEAVEPHDVTASASNDTSTDDATVSASNDTSTHDSMAELRGIEEDQQAESPEQVSEFERFSMCSSASWSPSMSDMVEVEQLEAENASLREENARLKAKMSSCDTWPDSSSGSEVSLASTPFKTAANLPRTPLQQLMEMGFPRVASSVALEATNGDIQIAISMLLSESVVKNLVDEASAVKNQALSQQTDNAPELGPPRPAIARLQALARGVLVRQGYYSPSYSRFPDALPSAVRVSTFVSSGGHVTVQLKIMMQTAVKDDVPEYSSPSTATAPPTMKGEHARREKPQKDQAAKEAVRQGIVIAVGMVVGLLAVVIMKNPARARAAACGAAAAVASLICKTKIRA